MGFPISDKRRIDINAAWFIIRKIRVKKRTILFINKTGKELSD